MLFFFLFRRLLKLTASSFAAAVERSLRLAASSAFVCPLLLVSFSSQNGTLGPGSGVILLFCTFSSGSFIQYTAECAAFLKSSLLPPSKQADSLNVGTHIRLNIHMPALIQTNKRSSRPFLHILARLLPSETKNYHRISLERSTSVKSNINIRHSAATDDTARHHSRRLFKADGPGIDRRTHLSSSS